MRRSWMVPALALALCVPAAAQTMEQKVSGEKGKVTAEQMVEASAVVQSINMETRELVLKNDKGEEMTMIAGADVQRLAEVKVGDTVHLQYYESLTIALNKVEGAPGMTQSAGEMRAEPSELPGGIKTTRTTLVAKITAVDAKANMITVVGPKGKSVTLHVEPDAAAKLKVGDLVSATYTEAVAVSISRVKVN